MPQVNARAMKQLSKHQVNKLTAKQLKEALPFEIVADGEVFAIVLPAKEYTKPKVPETKGKLTELPLSKQKQARGELAKNAFSPR